MPTAKTHLVDEVHARLVARASEHGMSVSKYLERVVIRDLEPTSESVRTADGEFPDGAPQLMGKTHLEQLALLNNVGELTYGTHVAFVNFVLVWAQVVAGKVDPRAFEWQKWAEEHLIPKSKSAGGNGRAEHREAPRR